MHERPKVFRNIKAFVQPGGYAAMRLCGLGAAEAFVDKTYLHFSGFADNQAARWDPTLARLFKLDPSKLPRIADPSEIVGALTARRAGRCGLRPGIPIAAGCGDAAASFLAGGPTGAGLCVDVAGTASVFASVTRSFKPDRHHKILSCGQAATPGLWHPYAYINGGGMNLEWFRQLINGRGRTATSQVPLGDLDRQGALLPPNEEAAPFLPHLGGRPAPPRP